MRPLLGFCATVRVIIRKVCAQSEVSILKFLTLGVKCDDILSVVAIFKIFGVYRLSV